MITVYRITRNHGKGDPADESESWTSEVEYCFVAEDEMDAFHENMAEEMGYQDYSFTIGVKQVMTIYGDELPALKEGVERAIAWFGKMKCDGCGAPIDSENITVKNNSYLCPKCLKQEVEEGDDADDDDLLAVVEDAERRRAQ